MYYLIGRYSTVESKPIYSTGGAGPSEKLLKAASTAEQVRAVVVQRLIEGAAQTQACEPRECAEPGEDQCRNVMERAANEQADKLAEELCIEESSDIRKIAGAIA